MDWPIQRAKARFSEVVNRTLKDGAQTITRNGKPVAVLVAIEEYQRLRSSRQKRNFKEFLASGPLGGMKIKRSRDTGRVVDFD